MCRRASRFLPEGSGLIAEHNSGTIKHMSAAGLVNPVGRVAGVRRAGKEACLVLPRGRPSSPTARLARTPGGADALRRRHATLRDQSPILTGIRAGAIHDGGRIAFGPDGKLYVATGESGNPQLTQDRSSLGGKILRINPDGSIPSDNLDPASPVWPFGHRNIQGLAWDSAGRLRATEYGANRLDELNLIRPGGNYGWPMAEGRADTPALIDPVIQWGTGEASPSGLASLGGALWVARDANIHEASVREFLKDRVSRCEQPRDIKIVETIPRNPAGKVIEIVDIDCLGDGLLTPDLEEAAGSSRPRLCLDDHRPLQLRARHLLSRSASCCVRG